MAMVVIVLSRTRRFFAVAAMTQFTEYRSSSRSRPSIVHPMPKSSYPGTSIVVGPTTYLLRSKSHNSLRPMKIGSRSVGYNKTNVSAMTERLEQTPQAQGNRTIDNGFCGLDYVWSTPAQYSTRNSVRIGIVTKAVQSVNGRRKRQAIDCLGRWRSRSRIISQ